MGSCVFKLAYCLYTDKTCGRCIHHCTVSSFQKEYGENAMHSKLTPFAYNDLLIMPIPVLMNNYAYMVTDMAQQTCILVDVGDATVIKKMKLDPVAILTTHKHWDHSGGNRAMRAAYPNLRIYGGALDHVPDCTHNVTDGQELRFGNLIFKAMWTPGHTKGHIVWRLDGSRYNCPDSVFTGDLIMLAGTGAVFEGSTKQHIKSLDLIKELPNETLMWPGHEVAVENLDLAVALEPDNLNAVLKMVWAFNQRELRMCTCPSTIGEEKQYNPFLRTTDPAMLATLGISDRLYCPHGHRVNEEEISELCFNTIIARAIQINNAKKKSHRRNAHQEGQTDGEERQQNQGQQLQQEQGRGEGQGQVNDGSQETHDQSSEMANFRIPLIFIHPPTRGTSLSSLGSVQTNPNPERLSV